MGLTVAQANALLASVKTEADLRNRPRCNI